MVSKGKRSSINLLAAHSSVTDIKQKSIRGGFATVSSQLARTILQIFSAAILGRILLPEDFGMIAMVMAITNLAVMLGELGLSAATIQKDTITQSEVSSLFWINAAFGFIITVITACISPLVALFYSDDRLLSISLFLSVSFLFSGLSVQHRALLSRNLHFLTISIVEMVSYTLSIITAIFLAMYGAGYWSLVVMHLSNPILRTLGFWIITPWKPSRPGKTDNLKSLIGFGGHVTVHSIVNYFSRNADNVLIGRFLGSELLGYYSRAYNLMMMPIRQIRSPLISVGMPALSRLQNNPKAYSRYYLSLTTIIAFFSVPLALFLGAFSTQIIKIILGPGWEDAAEVFKLLAIAGAVQPIVGTTGMVMLSSGNSKGYMHLGLVIGLCTVVSFAIGLPWGIKGVATSYMMLNLLSLFPQLIFAFRGTPIKIRDFLREIIYSVAASIFSVYIVWYWINRFLHANSIIIVFVGALLTLVLYLVFFLMSAKGRQQIRSIMNGFSQLVLKKGV